MSLKTSVLKNETCIQNGKLLLNLAMDTRFILAGETFRVADTDPGNISKSFRVADTDPGNISKSFSINI